MSHLFAAEMSDRMQRNVMNSERLVTGTPVLREVCDVGGMALGAAGRRKQICFIEATDKMSYKYIGIWLNH